MARNIGSNNCLPTAAIFSRFVAGRRVASHGQGKGNVREGCLACCITFGVWGVARGQLRLGNAFFAFAVAVAVVGRQVTLNGNAIKFIVISLLQ